MRGKHFCFGCVKAEVPQDVCLIGVTRKLFRGAIGTGGLTGASVAFEGKATWRVRINGVREGSALVHTFPALEPAREGTPLYLKQLKAKPRLSEFGGGRDVCGLGG